jgi:hypothetical protein
MGVSNTLTIVKFENNQLFQLTTTIFFLWASHAAVSIILRFLDLKSAWSLVLLLLVPGPRVCLESRIVNVQVCWKPWGLLGVPSLSCI